MEAVHTPKTDLSVLRGGPVMADYQAWDAPQQLAAESEVVLAGTVDGVEVGRILVTDEPDRGQSRVHHAVVRIAVDTVLAAGPVTEGANFAYVSIRRGGEITDADGTPVTGSGEGHTVTSVPTLAKALPKGTRVVVMSQAVDPTRLFLGADRVLDPNAGIGEGQPLLSGDNPQWLSFEDSETKLMSGWDGLSYDEVLAQLQAG